MGNASLPGVGDLVERLGAKALRGAGDRAAAERAIEFHRRLVIGQRPHHQALQAALHEVLARGGEQAAAEAQPLELRTQIKLVDFAVIEQAARPIAPVVGVASNLVAELQDGDAAALADGRVPPVRSAPVDQLAELVARDDALIGRPPCLVMGRGDVHRIGGLRTANLYEGGVHANKINDLRRFSCFGVAVRVAGDGPPSILTNSLKLTDLRPCGQAVRRSDLWKCLPSWQPSNAVPIGDYAVRPHLASRAARAYAGLRSGSHGFAGLGRRAGALAPAVM